MRLTTTLNRIRACSPCQSGWRKLLDYLGKDFDPDAEINLLTLLDSNDVPDLLWTLRATVQDSRKVASQLAIEFAEQALPIFEQRYPDDLRPRQVIQAARDYLDGKISVEKLRAAAYAAYAAYDAAAYAARAAYAAAAAAAAYDAARAAYAAYAAYDAAAYAARAAAAAAAYDAAAAAYDAAAYAAYAAAAAAAAYDAAAYAAYAAAARKKQAETIRSILE